MLIIGIAGGTGSGKTTVVNQILNELPANEVCVISQDSYYNETHNLSYQERTKINFDHPKAIDFDLLVSHINKLKKGEIIEPTKNYADIIIPNDRYNTVAIDIVRTVISNKL
jgi:uridine kinase